MILSHDLGDYKLLINILHPSIIKVRIVRHNFSEDLFKVGLTTDFSSSYAPKIIDQRDTLYILTKTTIVEIQKSTGKLLFKDITGKVLLRELNQLSIPGSNISSVTFAREPLLKFYGGGERGKSLCLEGTYYNYNRHNYGTCEGDPRIQQMSICVPWIVSSEGTGILFDDFSTSRFLIEKKTISYETDSKLPLSYFVINGENICNAVQLFTLLTGRQPLPPLWIFGYNSSRFSNKTQQDTLDIVNSIKESGFPLDSVMIDLWWQGNVSEMGSHTWSDKFRDHSSLVKVLKKNNIHTSVLVSPYVTSEGTASDNYQICYNNNLFCTDSEGVPVNINTWYSDKPTGLLDVSNPVTQNWLYDKYKEILSDDIDGFWCDLGEPEYHPNTCVHYNKLKAWEYHNKFSNDWAELIYLSFKNIYPNKRPVLLTRAGTTGIQKFSTFTWSGDSYKGWSGLQCQIKMMLSASISGIGYHSSDIGGFVQPSNRKTMPELYIRWLQLGTFSPVLRTHSQMYAEPFYYPEQYDIILNTIQERYRWLPFNYSSAFVNSIYGVPVCKPVNFFKSHRKLDNVTDEYLYGENVLVAPVIHKGKTKRKVTFPHGTWVDYYDSSKIYDELTTVEVEAPLDRIPVFIKSSSFLVLSRQDMQNTSEYDPSNLEVNLYYDTPASSYTLYDDDFQGPDNLTNKNYRAVKFSVQTYQSEIILTIEDLLQNNLERNFSVIVHNIEKVKDITVNDNFIPFKISGKKVYFKVTHNIRTIIKIS